MSALHFASVRQVAPVVLAALLVTLVAVPATAQTLPEPIETADLSGPRFGVTLLSTGVTATLRDRGILVKPYITQFGWQFEKQFFSQNSGVTMVTEWVVLAGGLDQGIALPSASWIVGIRGRDGGRPQPKHAPPPGR